jgi:precorrin-2 dehydrogenase/sirohydrochlorin ferrochelatase
VFDDEFRSFLEWLRGLREDAQATEADDERRRALLREALDGFKLSASVTYPKAWLEKRGKR